MAIITSLWWLWFIGLFVCATFGVWKWATTFWRVGGTIVKATTLTLEGIEVAMDEKLTVSEKAKHARVRVVQEVTKEGWERFVGVMIGFIAFTAAGVFGILFVLAIINMFMV